LGLPKKVQEYVFFQITNVDLFRKKISQVVPFITTMKQVIHDYDVINEHKKLNKDELVKLSGTNIAFSNFGLNKVSINKVPSTTIVLRRYFR
jgi:hypothetical protein